MDSLCSHLISIQLRACSRPVLTKARQPGRETQCLATAVTLTSQKKSKETEATSETVGTAALDFIVRCGCFDVGDAGYTLIGPMKRLLATRLSAIEAKILVQCFDCEIALRSCSRRTAEVCKGLCATIATWALLRARFATFKTDAETA